MKTKGIYFLYRVLQAFALPLLLFYFLFRGFQNRGYWRSLPQRFGWLPRPFRQTHPGAIWLHAVSVGEVLACLEFVRRLRAEFPRSAVFVSSTTLAGYATAREKLGDGVFYAPVDFVFAVRRVLRTLQPSIVIVAETEIWPNWYREVKRTGAALTVVNGRISDRAFERYARFAWLFRAVLPQADSILAQTPAIAERFVALGAPAERIRVGGNFKYDFTPRAADPSSPVLRWIERLRPAAVWIAASTMPPAAPGDVDEDDVVIEAYRELKRPDVLLILVPRKPERFDAAAAKLKERGVAFVRRTELTPATPPAPVLLLDTIGELSGLFAIADVVFMGGTLAERGGHNILEPALFGKPVIVGPHMENFQTIAEDFRAEGACVAIEDRQALAGAVAGLLDDPAEARAIGERARAASEARRGATARAVEEARSLYDRGVPCRRSWQPWHAIQWALSKLWKWGGERRMRRYVARRRKLGAPVISVGNLTMGGTGKTPCVLRLAELLRREGRRPGILTRGYGRETPEKSLALAAGSKVASHLSGDEPQLFVRSGLAPVGIGADRVHTGTLLLQNFDIDVLLLDDGFQHVRLGRDADIVLIDALQPFGGGGLFPLGRLREPLSGLARADIVLITRSRFSDLVPAIEREVRRWNTRAPIFRAGVRPVVWVEHATGQEFPLDGPPFRHAGAFCGLGNPLSFRRTLAAVGVEPAAWVEFEDHHKYRPGEIERIAEQTRASGGDAMVTTEKDMVNLCADCDSLAAPLKIYWLKVGMEIEREEDFFRAVLGLI